jgi:hypothetical protein
MQLVSYISADTFDLKLAETEKIPYTITVKSILYMYRLQRCIQNLRKMAAGIKPTYYYHKEPTQGSPFCFLYVPGLVVNAPIQSLTNPDYLYNYDKMSGNLLLKRNNESPIAVNRWQVKQFCLKTDKGGLIFMRVPLINNNEFSGYL